VTGLQIDSELLEKAVHESGHYVGLWFALHLFEALEPGDRDLAVGPLSIVENDDTPGESDRSEPPHVYRVNPENGDKEILISGVRAEIVRLFAGMLAQREYSTNIRARQLLADAWDDLQQVKHWLGFLSVAPGERARLREVANRAITENWDAVWRLATALYTYRELEPGECLMLIRDQTDEFEDYRELKEREQY
jgi:hypothetical protein